MRLKAFSEAQKRRVAKQLAARLLAELPGEASNPRAWLYLALGYANVIQVKGATRPDGYYFPGPNVPVTAYSNLTNDPIMTCRVLAHELAHLFLYDLEADWFPGETGYQMYTGSRGHDIHHDIARMVEAIAIP